MTVVHWIVTVLALLTAVAALVIGLRFPGIGIQAPALGGQSGTGRPMLSCETMGYNSATTPGYCTSLQNSIGMSGGKSYNTWDKAWAAYNAYDDVGVYQLDNGKWAVASGATLDGGDSHPTKVLYTRQSEDSKNYYETYG